MARDKSPFTLGHEATSRIYGMGEKAGGSTFCNESLSEGDRIALYVFLPCGNCWWERKFGNNHTLVCSQPREGYFGNPLDWLHFTAGLGEYIHPKASS